MEEKNWMELIDGNMQSQRILETNQYTEQFGLTLTMEDLKVLMEERRTVLKQEQRIEFGESILPEIIKKFCDSAYLTQDNYCDTLIRLQEIFFLFKNEMEDEITDEELLGFMREQFETVCFGDLDYLGGTCLEIFAQAVRAGYRNYIQTDGVGQFSQFDMVKRWDHELYLQALMELFEGVD